MICITEKQLAGYHTPFFVCDVCGGVLQRGMSMAIWDWKDVSAHSFVQIKHVHKGACLESIEERMETPCTEELARHADHLRNNIPNREAKS